MRLRDSDDILDEIQNASRFRSPKNVSTTIVDRMINYRWCTADDLVLAYSDLQNPDLDRVVAFFQLPFSIRLPDKWIKVRSQYGNPYIRFRAIDNRRDEGGVVAGSYESGMRTQVLMSYQLWERRRQLYATYLAALNEPRGIVKTKLKSTGFLNAVEYEQDLVKRLRLQTVEVLREFIPVYRVTCKDPFAYAPERLDAFFVMVKTGKVLVRDVVSAPPTPRQVQTLTASDYSRNLSALRPRLNKPWQPSIYETYLLEAARQVELGACNLAVVQTLMILDLFANEIIEDHLFGKMKKALSSTPKVYGLAYERAWVNEAGRIVPSTEEKYRKYFPIIGIALNPDLIGKFRKLNQRRNEIVHRMQADVIDRAEALSALDTGMAIIRHCMDCLLERNKRPTKNSSPEENDSQSSSPNAP